MSPPKIYSHWPWGWMALRFKNFWQDRDSSKKNECPRYWINLSSGSDWAEIQNGVAVEEATLSPVSLHPAMRLLNDISSWHSRSISAKFSHYRNSSLCFLVLWGPWPLRKEPFWGRSRWPRSRSVQGTPACPSSLSRSESECMRADEEGVGTGFSRANGEKMNTQSWQWYSSKFIFCNVSCGSFTCSRWVQLHDVLVFSLKHFVSTFPSDFSFASTQIMHTNRNT